MGRLSSHIERPPDNLELIKQDLAKPEKWKKSLEVAGELLV